MPTDAQRLACFESALVEAEAALAANSPAAIEMAPAPAPGNEGGRGFRIDIPFLGGREETARASARTSGTGLGYEQVSTAVRPPDADGPRVQAQVVSYRERVPGQWQFELDNGEVWRQVIGDTTRLNLFGREPLAAELWASWAGGYRMQLVNQDRTIQVERVR